MGNLNSLVLVLSIVQEPVTIVLGSHLRYVGLGSKRRLIDTNDTFEYIPLLQGLKCLLQNDAIRHEVSLPLLL